MKNSVMNFTALCGVVLEKKHKYFWLDYEQGKIKVYADKDVMSSIEKGYTLTVSGELKMGYIRTFLECNQCSIFDKKPHYFRKED